MLELPLPGDRRLQQLARADLGRFAAGVLLDPAAYAGRRIELAGDAPTPVAMAQSLAAVLDYPVEHQQVSVASIDNPDMHAMWTFLNGPSYQVDLAALHAAHPRVGWTSFATWAAEAFGDTPRGAVRKE